MHLRNTKSSKYPLPLNSSTLTSSTITSNSTTPSPLPSSFSSPNTPLSNTTIRKKKKKGFLLFKLISNVIFSKFIQFLLLNIIIFTIIFIKKNKNLKVFMSIFYIFFIFLVFIIIYGPNLEFEVQNFKKINKNYKEIISHSSAAVAAASHSSSLLVATTSSSSIATPSNNFDNDSTYLNSSTPYRIRILKFIRKRCIPLVLKKIVFELILNFRLLQSNFNTSEFGFKTNSSSFKFDTAPQSYLDLNRKDSDREKEKERERNNIKTYHSIFSWFNPIDENILLGAIPLRDLSHHHQLTSNLSLSLVISLNMKWELDTMTLIGGKPCNEEDWKSCGVEFVNYPCEDFEPVPFEVLEKASAKLDQYVRDNHRVYIHCKSGLGRSAAVVIAYLVIFKQLRLPEAHQLVRDRRRKVFNKESIYYRNLELFFKSR